MKDPQLGKEENKRPRSWTPSGSPHNTSRWSLLLRTHCSGGEVINRCSFLFPTVGAVMLQFRHVNFLAELLYRRALTSFPFAQKACDDPALLWPHPALTGCLTGQTVSLLGWLLLLASGEDGRWRSKHLRTTTAPCWAPPVYSASGCCCAAFSITLTHF